MGFSKTKSKNPHRGYPHKMSIYQEQKEDPKCFLRRGEKEQTTNKGSGLKMTLDS